MKFFDTATY